MRRRHLSEALVVAAAAVGALVRVLRGPAWTVDDAYIVARYAENLAHHGRFAWNLQGDRVLGLTGELLGLLEALGAWVGLSPVACAKGIGMASLLVAGPLILACARVLRAPYPAGAIAAVVYLLVGEHVAHVPSGLETELYAALSLATALAFAKALTSGRPGWLGPVALLLTLARPEGLAVGPILFVVAASAQPRARRPFLRAFALGYILPVAFVAAARVLYFHALLPNTFAAKLDPLGEHRFLPELGSFFGDYALDAGLVSIACVVSACLVRGGRGRWSPASRRAAAVVAASALIHLALLVPYARSNLLMGYSRRFSFHLLPWQILGLLPLLGRATFVLRRDPRRSARLATALLLLLVLTRVATRGAAHAVDARTFAARYDHSTQSRYVPAAEWLRGHLGPEAHLACYPDAGIVPYLTHFAAIDFGGLNDRALARVRSPEAVAEYFFAQRPDALVVDRVGDDLWYDDGANAIHKDPRFADYELGARFGAPEGSALLVYVRRR